MSRAGHRPGRNGWRMGRVATGFCVACFVGLTHAQDARPTQDTARVYVKESDQAKTFLRTADAYIRDAKWSEALDALERLVSQFPESVYALDKHRYISLRDYCHRRLAKLPPEALALYRRRVDVPLGVRFERARQARDAAALERLVDEGLCASVGDEALDLLGEWAFERGDFHTARAYWRRILEVYPDPSVDRASVQAKATLCLVALGQREQARQELAALAKAHGDAEGWIAGRKQNLVKALQTLMSVGMFRARRRGVREDWPTLGGSAQRTAIVSQPVEKGGFQWRVELRDPKSIRDYRQRQQHARRNWGRRTQVADEGWLSFHPIVVGEEVIVCDQASILGIDLHTGKRKWFFNIRGQPPGRILSGSSTRRATRGGVTRFTLSAEAGRVYACLGQTSAPDVRFQLLRRQTVPSTYLVAINLRSREIRRSPLWRTGSALGRLKDLRYEGTPLGADGDCFVCLSRGTTIRQCYVARLDGATGRLKWLRYVCEGARVGRRAPPTLVTLAGQSVYCCTNLGIIASLRASDGGTQWLARYPRVTTPRASHAPRDVNPCVYADGVVFAAPSDATDLIALDACTGRRRWLAPAGRVRYLLGTNHSLLLAAADVPVAYDVATGRRVWPRAIAPVKEAQATYGRGVLAGDMIYWPTRTAVERIDQRTGRRARPPWSMSAEPEAAEGGNLLVSQGFLLVATRSRLAAFCQYSLLIKRFQSELVDRGGDPVLHLRLGKAAVHTGQYELAEKSFLESLKQATPKHRIDGRSLVGESRRHLYAALMTWGREGEKAGRRDDALARYRRAGDQADTAQHRLEAWAAEARIQEEADRYADAVAVYQRMLGMPDMRTLSIGISANVTATSAVLAWSRINHCIQRGGRDVYGPFERKARRLLQRAKDAASAELAERLVAEFPNAEVVPAALRWLGDHRFDSGQYSLAARRYHQHMTRFPDTDTTPQVIWRLARCYEQQRLWTPARALLVRLASRFPDARVAIDGSSQRAEQAVKTRLSAPPYDALTDGVEPQVVRLPLFRRWSGDRRQQERIVAPQLGEGASELSHWFSTEKNVLRCYSATTGRRAWQRALDRPVRWLALRGASAIAWTGDTVCALDLAGGEMSWQYKATGTPRAKTDRARPARKDKAGKPADPNKPSPDPAPSRLDAVPLLTGDLLVYQHGTGTLTGLHAGTGEVRWQREWPDGLATPGYADRDYVIVQTLKPSEVVALDARTGLPKLRLAVPNARLGTDPVRMEGDRLVVGLTDGRIILYDLSAARRVWTYQGMGKGHAPVLACRGEWLVGLTGGRQLVRLDGQTGRAVWTELLGQAHARSDRHHFALDDTHVYLVRHDRLEARRLSDGAAVWQTHLSGPRDASWHVRRRARLVWCRPVRVEPGVAFPVVFCRADTGRLVQQLNFHATGHAASVQMGSQWALVAFHGQVWGLGSQAAGDR